jgi:hypothetical protein
MDGIIQWVSDLIARLGTALDAWARCVYANLRAFVNGGEFGSMILGFIGIFFVGLLVVIAIAAVTGQWELVAGYVAGMAIIALFLFGIRFVIELLAIMASCATSVRGGGVSAALPGTASDVGTLIASGAITGCPEAEALLARAQAALEAARSARDRQADRVDTARTRVRNARSAMYAASASAAAALWEPWTLAAALAALAAAVVLLARRTRQLAEQIALLALREAELLRALADVGAAEALVATLCGGPLPTATNGIDPGVLAGGVVPVSTMML